MTIWSSNPTTGNTAGQTVIKDRSTPMRVPEKTSVSALLTMLIKGPLEEIDSTSGNAIGHCHKLVHPWGVEWVIREKQCPDCNCSM